ncbi:hypothetical protein MesoLj113a_45140 [Mesorhizobium sp. 113-1-2]|uniref:lipase family protein n=1 Tax=Mesorhizobium sp. 113-1-2 TaxID=2744515 RepID=UPI0019353A9E|nr:protease pro-enzyme activation domain-containing protein [Mesorhizobium sp. 113-1-2]BCG73356.1 hypothetical protein MesoLj113a_45140 [Mesorhizobium sp. 113-1-2]
MIGTRKVIPGSFRAIPPGAVLIGPTDPTAVIDITILLEGARDISDQQIAHHLSRPAGQRAPREIGALKASLAATDEAVKETRAFLQSFGIEVTKQDPEQQAMRARGTVANMELAFDTTLTDYQVGAVVERLREGALSVPQAAYPFIRSVLGLDNRRVARPRYRAAASSAAFYPNELAKLYGFPDGDGEGQVVAIIELGGNYDEEDLNAYLAAAGVGGSLRIQRKQVNSVLPVPYGSDPDSDGEVMLDIEVVAAIAPRASIVVYFADNTDQDFYQAVSDAVYDPATTAVSISWGGPEDTWSYQSMDSWNLLGQKAILLDVAIFAAAGDSGCADRLPTDPRFDGMRHVDFPGSCANGIASCGGTSLRADAGGVASESVWNDGRGGATGGGISTYFQQPSWQKGISAEGGLPLAMRGVPDIAGDADPETGIRVRYYGADTTLGGTSAVAPQWAALTALLGQRLGHKPGFFLPLLYDNRGAVSQITKGDNDAYGVKGFSAGADWNACTGLGTPKGDKILGLLAASSGGVAAGSITPVSDLDLEADPSPEIKLAQSTATTFDAKQALFLGRCVDAAYTMYRANPAITTPQPGADFPAGYDLVAWIRMQDFLFGRTAPLFYGYVAKSRADPTQFVLALRGTETPTEWIDDALSVRKVAFSVPGCGQVGEGWARIYETLEVIAVPTGASAAASASVSLRTTGSFSKQVTALIGRHTAVSSKLAGLDKTATLQVSAHSLGSALATLYVMENAKTDQLENPLLCTFASPLVGDRTFALAFNALDITSWRIVNLPDLVCYLPPEFLGFHHINSLQQFSALSKVKPNESCWHAMATYLSLLDPSLTPRTDCQVDAMALAKRQVAGASFDVVTTTDVGPLTLNLTINIQGGGK